MTSPAALRSDRVCQRTLDHLSALVLIWTPEEGVIYANRSWRELTGTSLEDNTGKGWLRCVHETDRAAVEAALGSGSTHQARREYRVQARDGHAVAVTDNPCAWSDDDSQEVLGVVHTITPRDVAPADEDRGRTMSTWAHELRGPLNAILGWSDLLSAGDAGADVLQRGLKAIANNARQQALIIKRMTE